MRKPEQPDPDAATGSRTGLIGELHIRSGDGKELTRAEQKALQLTLQLTPDEAKRLLQRCGAKDLAELGVVGAQVDAPRNGDYPTTVFIGHGRSPVWLELKSFLQDRLKLRCDDFNSSSAVGMTTAARLQQVVRNADCAFLVLTGEDMQEDSSIHPRLNVVHEVGLFQAQVGFERAAVLIEEGCTEFSNIVGLTQIRFPAGNIRAVFEDVRYFLEREGLISHD